MVNHGTLVKIMANHDTWNACQDHVSLRSIDGNLRPLKSYYFSNQRFFWNIRALLLQKQYFVRYNRARFFSVPPPPIFFGKFVKIL